MILKFQKSQNYLNLKPIYRGVQGGRAPRWGAGAKPLKKKKPSGSRAAALVGSRAESPCRVQGQHPWWVQKSKALDYEVEVYVVCDHFML